jgi:hypothetical protein
MGVWVLAGPKDVGVDRAPLAMGEEELGGVSIHVKLIIGGNDLESIVNDILAEDGGAGLFIGVAEPAESWVDTWHWATRCRRACLFTVLIFQDQGKGWDGLIIHYFCGDL